MALPIEDYALIGNLRTAALVGRDGSIDWLCVPRFDDAACFCALLGTPEHGRWSIAPTSPVRRTRRRYSANTLILETDFGTSTGSVRIVDFMPTWGERTDVVRIVEGVRGRVSMRMELVLRFGYGNVIPWVRQVDGTLMATAGPYSAQVRGAVETHGEDFRTVAEFTVARGERIPFVITFFPSHLPAPLPIDPFAAHAVTQLEWEKWSARCAYTGRWRDAVMRSLITLKSLTFMPTGGIVAAPTTSLPEQAGGPHNWDYRYCWVRDATFTLYALLLAGYRDEAAAWRDWLLRSAAGRPDDLQTLYGVDGDRIRPNSRCPGCPVTQIRNRSASATPHPASFSSTSTVSWSMPCPSRAKPGSSANPDEWRFEAAIVKFLEKAWNQPDHGIWEIRGEKRHFTHSKVMAWVAFDRAIRESKSMACAARSPMAQAACAHPRRDLQQGLRSHAQHLRAVLRRDGGRCEPAADSAGRLPAARPILACKERSRPSNASCWSDGLVMRYRTLPTLEGLPPGEGQFLACSFWLVDALTLCGRKADAEKLFERLLALCNDVGLLSEEYDPRTRPHAGQLSPGALAHGAHQHRVQSVAQGRTRAASQPEKFEGTSKRVAGADCNRCNTLIWAPE